MKHSVFFFFPLLSHSLRMSAYRWFKVTLLKTMRFASKKMKFWKTVLTLRCITPTELNYKALNSLLTGHVKGRSVLISETLRMLYLL